MADNSLRPQKLADMIGMDDNRRRIGMSIQAAKERKSVLGHVLISGSRGLGKTSLAMCIANEIGTELYIANAATIKLPKDLISLLKNLNRGDVLFLDEVHSLPRQVEEFLYQAMEDFFISLPMGRSRNVVNIDLEEFTLIGATTLAGQISAPMRDRFRFRENLTPYSDVEIAKIITANSLKLNCSIKENAAMEIAIRSRNTPRISISHLMWCRDVAQLKRSREITHEIVKEAMEEQKIDSMGFTPVDRTYLYEIYNTFGGGPAGVAALSSQMFVEEVTIENDIEPYLMIKGMILRTPNGRCLDSDGWTYCQKNFK